MPAPYLLILAKLPLTSARNITSRSTAAFRHWCSVDSAGSGISDDLAILDAADPDYRASSPAILGDPLIPNPAAYNMCPLSIRCTADAANCYQPWSAAGHPGRRSECDYSNSRRRTAALGVERARRALIRLAGACRACPIPDERSVLSNLMIRALEVCGMAFGDEDRRPHW